MLHNTLNRGLHTGENALSSMAGCLISCLKYCGAFRDVNLNYFTHLISVMLYFIIQHFFHLLFLFVVSLHSMLSIKEQEGSFSWLLKKEFGSLLNLYQRWEA